MSVSGYGRPGRRPVRPLRLRPLEIGRHRRRSQEVLKASLPAPRRRCCVTAFASPPLNDNPAWTTASLGIAIRCVKRSHERLRKFRASRARRRPPVSLYFAREGCRVRWSPGGKSGLFPHSRWLWWATSHTRAVAGPRGRGREAHGCGSGRPGGDPYRAAALSA